jgi:hypothetical protein
VNPPVRRLAAALRLALVPLVVLSAGLAAQAPNAADAQQPPPVTREEIESRALAAERSASALADERAKAQKHAEAAALRKRLRDGDFQEGDRLFVTIEATGLPRLTDTVTVRADRMIALDSMTGAASIPLQGVLRSELQPYLTAQVSRYLRSPVVRATPLIRLGVLGPVGRPGYYWMGSDVPVSDAITVAGGLTSAARIHRTVIKRNSKQVLDTKALQQAMRAGLTLDQLQLRPGDEIVVGDAGRGNWLTVARGMTALAGSLITIRYIIRRL